jgi:hypothetical protein
MKWVSLMHKQYNVSGYNIKDDVNYFAYLPNNVAKIHHVRDVKIIFVPTEVLVAT